MRAPHYFRRLNILEDEAFTYGQRIALGQLFEGEAENEYGRLLKAFRIVYEYSPRLLPRSVRFSRINGLSRGIEGVGKPRAEYATLYPKRR